MTDAELNAELQRAANAAGIHPLGRVGLAVAERLVAEIRRLRRGDFTPDEFQSLCHHRDEQPGCTRADFEAGCRAYQDKLFGAPPAVVGPPVRHPSHEWNGTVLNLCIRCGVFHSQPAAFAPCDSSALAGKLEYCCNCAAEYPRSDLIAGEIYCPLCRKVETPGASGAPG